MPDERCDELREPVAELALGIASGEQRARVLDHTGRCASCQRLLGELALVGDELLLLAPEHEPPPGFEVRVIERLGRPRKRRPSDGSRCAGAAPPRSRRSPPRSRPGPRRPPGAARDGRRAAPRGPAPSGAVARERQVPRRDRAARRAGPRGSAWCSTTAASRRGSSSRSSARCRRARYVATLVTRAGTTSELGTVRARRRRPQLRRDHAGRPAPGDAHAPARGARRAGLHGALPVKLA